MAILVTGGAGFMGSHIADQLIDKGHQVIILDDLSGGFKSNVNNQATFIEGSITDQDLIEKIFNENKIEYVFHLAAYAAEGLSHFIRRFNYTNNLIGSINLINESIKHKVKCFVFTSSIAVYGENQLPMTEEITPLPEDPYGIAKLAIENDLAAAKKMFGLDSIIFRPHNVYGERQNLGDKYRNVIGIFMNQIMQDKPLTIFGDGKQQRAFSHINDIAPIIANSINVEKAYNQTYNIGADTPYTVLELAKTIMKSFGKEVSIKHLEERKEVKIAYADHSKVIKDFEHKAQIDLIEGVNMMADWAKKEGVKQSEEFHNIEIRENLPDGW